MGHGGYIPIAKKSRIGLWFVGARGSVATTAMVGAFALARGITSPWGLVTELPEFAGLDLLDFDQIVFGGWDVTSVPILERVKVLVEEDHAVSADVVAAVHEELALAEANIRYGYFHSVGAEGSPTNHLETRQPEESLATVFERLGDDIDDFSRRNDLQTVVVINLSSTEASIPMAVEYMTIPAIRQAIREDKRSVMTPGIMYTLAAIDRGFPYLNFTPSVGVNLPVIQALAAERGVPFYGSDGKSGETLLKTVLAPMFRMRNLEVLSWQGFNILGGGDGQSLSEPQQRDSKVKSKSGVLSGALGYPTHNGVFIEYVPSLGNWKTAWDFVHFRGFLGTKMSLQFTWQGCDSILAAPLVLDLTRLTEFAVRCGETGPMVHLACFFKDPLSCSVQAFADQTQMLLNYVQGHEKRVTEAGRNV